MGAPRQRNRRVTLQSPAQGRTPTGKPAAGWVDEFSVYAALTWGAGGETGGQDRDRAGVAPMLTIARQGRWDQIRATWRVILADGVTAFEITAPPRPTRDGRHVEISLRAAE